MKIQKSHCVQAFHVLNTGKQHSSWLTNVAQNKRFQWQIIQNDLFFGLPVFTFIYYEQTPLSLLPKPQSQINQLNDDLMLFQPDLWI